MIEDSVSQPTADHDSIVEQAPTRRRRSRVARFMRVLALLILGVLAGPQPGEARQDAEDLAQTILTHIRQCLPASASRSVEYQSGRVRAFANMVTMLFFYPTELPKLQAAAIAAIDAANDPAATADSLLRAAIAGVSTYSRSKVECVRCRDAHREPSPPTSIEAGTVRLISLPSLNLPEARESKPCSAFDHYFDFPTEGVSGVVLDLRGNPGGDLPTVLCVAGQFLTPKTPLMRVTGRLNAETQEIPADSRRTPLTLPLAIFVNQDTESGALALAAALRDAHRARLIGESKDHANATVLILLTVRNYLDRFLLPIAEMSRINGASLAAGIQVDIAVPAQDDGALMDAARALFGGSAQQ
jgi:Peptidase family S41